MSSSLSWGNVPSVSANQQQRNSKTTSIKRNAKDPQQQQQDNSQQRTNDNNYTVDEFVQRVTNLSKQVEQYKQLSNQRAQQVAISFFNNNNSSALSGTTLSGNGTIQSASSDSFNHSQDNLRVGGNDITKKIRSIRQWCTSEVNELKKISNKIGSKIGNENRLMMESGLNSNTESNSSSINSQHETMVKYNRVKNDLTKTITVLKDVIRRDKEWIAQQTKQKQELFAAHQTPLSDVYDEEEEIHAEDHPLLSGSASNASHHGGKTSQVVQELQENALVSWQDSTLNVEMKIAMEEYEDLKTYQSEYHELNHLFHSFSTLVDEQDPMLDTIHTNVITSKDNVERGVESLKESNKLRKQGSKVMWIVLALVLLTVIAVALIIIFGKGVIW